MYDKTALMNADQTDLNTKHHFSDSIYAKEMHLPKGHVAITHKHSYSHLSILAKGKCVVYLDGKQSVYNAGDCIEIKAGVEHQIEALEDITWFCIHATEEKDPNKIDRVAIQNASI